jgi:Tol biopolymer transport system component
MELVEGPTLADRIARGAIPVDETLAIATQIAEALGAAHEQGIIHRDLKPANIKVRDDGTVKVLDFGLAKALEPKVSSADVVDAPTITSPLMTHAGVILGTPAYMSPEQARGKPIDKRADIWAFGCVLYEMLTGARPFPGNDVTEPNWNALPSGTPIGIKRVLVRCLMKDPKQRLHDIADARLELEDAAHDTRGPVLRAPTPVFWRAAPWGVAAAVALIAGWAVWSRTGSSTTAPLVTHVEIGYPADVEPFIGRSMPPAISPDGRAVARIALRDGLRRVFIHRLDRDEAATDLPETVGANGAVFSPDSASVAVLLTSGRITRIGLADQQRQLVTSGADFSLPITWNQAGIFFCRGGALWIVSPEGGAPRQLTELDPARHEVAHLNAVVLPGGRLVLFASETSEPGSERIESVPIDGGPRSVVVERARFPVWSPTGHLLFMRDAAVFALALDPRTGKALGAATRIISAGAIEPIYMGQLALSLSSTGTLVFAPAGFTDRRLVSVGRDGAALLLDPKSGRYGSPRISPDGKRLLVENGGSIEVLNLERHTWSTLASTSASSFCTWSADGTRVVFAQFGSPVWVTDDGSFTGSVRGGGLHDTPVSPGPDPDSFFANRISSDTESDIYLMSISGAFQPKPVIHTPAYDGGAQLSPDKQWLVYQSDQLGRPEIYVRRYPTLAGPWPVSAGGGIQPRWSRDMKEIYYRDGVHVVAVTFHALGAEPTLGKPEPLFTDDYDYAAGLSVANYEVTADGRFIMTRRGVNGGRLHVVFNWTEELKQILASGGVR